MPFKPLEQQTATGEVFRASPGMDNRFTPFKKEEVKEDEGFIKKASSLADKTFGKAANLLFGSTGKAVGGLITSGIGSAMQFSSKPEIKAKGEFLERKGTEQITPANIAFTALELYPGGGYLSKTLKKLPGGEKVAETLAKIPESLKEKAIKQYSEALGATKEEFKALTKKVVPELLERGVKSKSLEKLSARAEQESAVFGKAVDEFIETIPETTKMKVQPVIDALNKTKSDFIVEGVNLEPGVTKAADSLKGIIAKFGEDISPSSLRRVRQVWDRTVAKAGGFVGKTLKEGSEIDLKKVATNAIREELGKEFPELKRLNAEFNFWENVEKITKETLKRKSTQGKGLSQIITSTVGGATGFATGEDFGERLKNAALGAVLGKYSATFNSPGYKMLSANTKNKLAKIIASGDIKKIRFALAKIASALKNLSNR